jgi:uncharacterized protein (DUF1697 family)
MPSASKRSSHRRWVALLRAVNLGSRNKVSMSALKELLADAGAEDVVTYVQSGNVVFSSDARSADELERSLAADLRRRLGLDVAVMVRTAAELAKVERGNPFADDEQDDGKLLVTFLGSAPTRAAVRSLRERDVAPDELHVRGREVYLHCPRGYGRSNVSNALVERQLAVAATTRNWRTVKKLVELSAT